MKKLFITIFLLGMTTISIGQSIIIRSVEKTHGQTYIDNGLYVTDETGETTFIEYEQGKFNKVNGPRTKVFQSILNKYLKEGYKLSSSTGSSVSAQGYGIVITTYILIKE